MTKSIGRLEFLAVSEDFSHYKDKIQDLDQLYMDYPWKSVDWDNLHSQLNIYRVFVLKLEGKIVGFAMYSLANAPQAHLLKVVIAPEHRGHALGKFLLEFAHQQFKANSEVTNIYLEVEKQNVAAIRIYDKLDFQLLCEKKHFYSSGEDALIMQAILK